jgi:hypothetical protein
MKIIKIMYRNLLVISVLFLSVVTTVNASWVAAGSTETGGVGNAVIVTSTDGYSWTRVTLPKNYIYLQGVTSDGLGKWVAIGGDAITMQPVILYSSDMNNWQIISPPHGDIILSGIAYGNNMWVTVGTINYMQHNEGPVIMTSPDGIHWSMQSLNLPEKFRGTFLTSVAFADGKWVAVGGGITATSSDAINWTCQQPISWQWPASYSITHGNNRWVSVGPMGSEQEGITTSLDGLSWNLKVITTDSFFSGIAYGNGHWMIIASSLHSSIFTSQDTLTWSQIASELDLGAMRSIAYGNGMWVIAGKHNYVMASKDNGASWVNLPISTDEQIELDSVAYSQ